MPIGEVANSGDFSGTDDPAAELIKIVETRNDMIDDQGNFLQNLEDLDTRDLFKRLFL